MATLPLPGVHPDDTKAFRDRLYDFHRIEVPAFGWPVAAALDPGRALAGSFFRISAQLYNEPADYERLATALEVELAAA
jgi:hypothetical protein